MSSNETADIYNKDDLITYKRFNLLGLKNMPLL